MLLWVSLVSQPLRHLSFQEIHKKSSNGCISWNMTHHPCPWMITTWTVSGWWLAVIQIMSSQQRFCGRRPFQESTFVLFFFCNTSALIKVWFKLSLNVNLVKSEYFVNFCLADSTNVLCNCCIGKLLPLGERHCSQWSTAAVRHTSFESYNFASVSFWSVVLYQEHARVVMVQITLFMLISCFHCASRSTSFLFKALGKNNDATFVRMRNGDHLEDAKMSKKGTSLRRI